MQDFNVGDEFATVNEIPNCGIEKGTAIKVVSLTQSKNFTISWIDDDGHTNTTSVLLGELEKLIGRA
jgi:hypothetical protein